MTSKNHQRLMLSSTVPKDVPYKSDGQSAQSSVESQRELVSQISSHLIAACGELGHVVSADPNTHPEGLKWNQAIPILAAECDAGFWI